ncbi:MAG: hypothetical protein WC455_15730 [Dehalococcoidia bacterium]|jgi:hypothetical protein
MPYRIENRPGHKDSEGKRAPYVIINKDTNRIVGSSSSKEKAQATIRARYAHEK